MFLFGLKWFAHTEQYAKKQFRVHRPSMLPISNVKGEQAICQYVKAKYKVNAKQLNGSTGCFETMPFHSDLAVCRRRTAGGLTTFAKQSGKSFITFNFQRSPQLTTGESNPLNVNNKVMLETRQRAVNFLVRFPALEAKTVVRDTFRVDLSWISVQWKSAIVEAGDVTSTAIVVVVEQRSDLTCIFCPVSSNSMCNPKTPLLAAGSWKQDTNLLIYQI